MSEDLVNEISAINSIYGEDTLCVVGDAADNRPTDCVFSIPSQNISLSIRFPPRYPDCDDPPTILGVTSVGGNARKGFGQHVWRMTEDALQETYVPGSVCLFTVLETLEDRLHGGGLGEGEGEQDEEKSKQKNDQPTGGQEERDMHTHVTQEHLDAVDYASSEQIAVITKPPLPSDSDQSSLPSPGATWTHSDVITVKKSVFLARAAIVSSPVDACACLAALVQTDRRAAKATHNISAYRIPRSTCSSSVPGSHPSFLPPGAAPKPRGRSKTGEPPGESDVSTNAAGGTKPRFDEDFDDDGENAAGARLLKQLQLMDARGVLVVVSRWYGGVKLGPARFGIICGAGKEAVVRLIEGQRQGEGEDQPGGGGTVGRG